MANFEVSAQCFGRTFRIPLFRHMGLRVLDSKGGCLQTIIGALFVSGKRGHFIDIGANVGQTLLTLRSICDLTYIGFEPDITAAYYVNELIRRNGFENAEVLSIALGSQNSSGLFHSNGPADESATLGLDLRPQRMYANTTRVAVCRGDDLIMALPEPHIFMIKIDVEGSEIEVLKGLENTIKHCRPPVYFEVMGYRHLLDGTYPRRYFGGELPPGQISRLVENRRSNMQKLREFWVEREYLLLRALDDGTIRSTTTLDEPDSPGEMNFLAVPEADISSFTEAMGASMVRV
jgi:FkbM family methyltransferase